MDDTADLWRLSATQLQRHYREGSLTPVQVVQSCLARIDAVNPQLNALVARRDAAVFRDAEASARRLAQGRPLSALDGVPLTIKDNLLTHDMPTTWGTRGLSGHTTDHDELPVARARAAGALLVGKTNVPEFTLEGFTGNPLHGCTRNPWNTALTPGGSSGGAVASVAAGCTPLALGTDGGGSTRRPASHCGLVGLKPSIGAIARAGGLPSLLLDFEVIGTIGRTVPDTRLLLEALRGPSEADRSSLAAAQAAGRMPARRDGGLPHRLRLLYVERWGDAPLDPQIAASVRRAVNQLAAAGHGVEEAAALPLDLGFWTEAWPQVSQIGLAALFRAHPAWGEAASDKYRRIAAEGERLGAARLWQMLEQVEVLRARAAAMFEGVDVVITPATAALPWPAAEAYPTRIDGQEVGPRGHAVYTGWVNAAGLPALALPCAPSREGLPIGLQLIGPYGADDLLLDLAAAFEAASPWADRWPPLAG